MNLKELLSGAEKVTNRSPLAKVIYVAGVTTFCTFLACWAVLAHQENASGSSQRTILADDQFARNAAQGGMAEVQLGHLAEEKGTSPSVKKFGQRMVQDHTKANDELKAAAAKANIALPDDLSAKDQATYDALSELSGEAFDSAYARDMVKDHEEDIAEFSREANAGQKDAVKNFAAQTLPTLKDQLKEAREMRRTLANSVASAPKGSSATRSQRR
jgi:putative membrane protein